MGKTTLAVLVTVAFSLVGVLGDYFLKLASAREQPLLTGLFYLGFALYASTAFGWVFVMRHLKLATISVLYSVSMVLLLTALHDEIAPPVAAEMLRILPNAEIKIFGNSSHTPFFEEPAEYVAVLSDFLGRHSG